MKRPALAGNRTTSLCSQCSATELQQQDNYQLSQSSVHVLHRCMEPKCPSHIPSFSSYFSLFQCKARVPSKRMGPIDDESCNWHIIASELFRSLRMYSVDGISWNNVFNGCKVRCKARKPVRRNYSIIPALAAVKCILHVQLRPGALLQILKGLQSRGFQWVYIGESLSQKKLSSLLLCLQNGIMSYTTKWPWMSDKICGKWSVAFSNC